MCAFSPLSLPLPLPFFFFSSYFRDPSTSPLLSLSLFQPVSHILRLFFYNTFPFSFSSLLVHHSFIFVFFFFSYRHHHHPHSQTKINFLGFSFIALLFLFDESIYFMSPRVGLSNLTRKLFHFFSFFTVGTFFFSPFPFLLSPSPFIVIVALNENFVFIVIIIILFCSPFPSLPMRSS